MFFSLIYKKKALFLVLLTSVVFTSFYEVVVPFFTGKLFESVLQGQRENLYSFLLLSGLFLVFERANQFIFLLLERRFSIYARNLIRENIYKLILESNPRDILLKGQGNFSLFTNDVDIIMRGLKGIISIFGIFSSLLTVLGVLIWINPVLALIVVFFISFCSIVPFIFKPIMSRLGKEYSLSFQKYVASVKDMSDGYFSFRIARGGFFSRFYKGITSSYQFNTWKVILKNIGVSMVTNFFANLPAILSISFVGIFAYYNYISIVTLFVVDYYVYKLTDGLRTTFSNINDISFARGVLNRFNSMKFNTSNEKATPFSSISLEQLSFKFSEKNLIQDLNFSFRKGKKYAIRGRSGCGKSTLIDLITGLLKPTAGRILWNEKILHNLDPKSLLEQVHVISTDEVVFETTLRNNMTMFREDLDKKQVLAAQKELGLEHIEIDKEINVNSISAGEMQRILLARALLEPKKLLILDEALSNLDEANKKKIEDIFLNNKELTLIHVSHHISQLERYDEILELDG